MHLQRTYSAKLKRAGADCYITQTFHTSKGINYWKGRTVTISCWVYATVADRAFIYVYDGVGAYSSTKHTGDSTWQLLTKTFTVDASATTLTATFYIQTGDTSAYFDGAMCVEGSSAFAFSPKPMIYEDVRYEVINFSRNIAAVNGAVNYTTTAGKVPKAFIFSGGLVGYCFFTGNDDKTTKGSSFHVQGGVVGAGITDYSIIITDGTNTEKGYVSGAIVNQFTITWTATSSPTGTAYISALVFY